MQREIHDPTDRIKTMSARSIILILWEEALTNGV